MVSLHIQKLKTRYRLPASAAGAQDRLESIRQEVLYAALAEAMESIGIAAHEEICIRRVEARLKLRLALSDDQLINHWSTHFAEQIREALACADDQLVVRYNSRFNGLVDFALGVASARLNRAWAWNQLGIAQLNLDAPSCSEALDQLVTVLIAERHLILPLFVALARAGQLAQLTVRFAQQEWRELAQTAVAAVAGYRESLSHAVLFIDADDEALLLLLSKFEPKAEPNAQWVDQSLIARAVLKHGSAAQLRAHLSALAVFVAIEVSPEIFLGTSEQLLLRLHGYREVLKSCLSLQLGPKQPQSHTPQEARETHKEPWLEKYARQQGSASDRSAVDHEGAVEDVADDIKSRMTLSVVPGSEETGGDSLATHDEPWRLCRSDETEFAGLLFLLSLIDELAIVETIAADAQLNQRPLRWWLYQLARQWIDGDDPAVYAFCGLVPGDDWPWPEAPPLDDRERQVIKNWSQRLIDCLRRRLVWPATEDERLIDTVIRRHARIQAEPGWFEILFSLRQVSTDIRRAALDLDPGYLPWLGVVVTFRYEASR